MQEIDRCEVRREMTRYSKLGGNAVRDRRTIVGLCFVDELHKIWQMFKKIRH